MFGFSTNATSVTNSSPSTQDHVVPGALKNLTVSRFNKQNNVFSAANWDGEVAIWSINQNIQPYKKKKFQGPVLDIDWASNNVIIAGADKSVKMWNAESDQVIHFGTHEASVSSVLSSDGQPAIVISGGWDKKVKLYDLRQQNAQVAEFLAPERVYSIDSREMVLVAGCAKRKIELFDMRKFSPNSMSSVKSMESPLRMQTRAVRVLKKVDGIVISSIEGRISVYFFNDESRSFNFKAHRDKIPNALNETAHAVNDIAIHPLGTFATCGGDGRILFWDKSAKMKLKTFDKLAEPIVSGHFNKDGSLLVYASSYDYGQGKDGKSHGSGLFIKQVLPADINPK